MSESIHPSTQAEYDLLPVVDLCVEDFLWRNMSWSDTARIAKTSIASSFLPIHVAHSEGADHGATAKLQPSTRLN
jgi:hypothetical protein